MVRTRHSGDINEEDSPKFMSLEHEKERFRSTFPRREVSVDNESTNLRGAYQDDDYDIFEDKVVDSRLRPRTGPRRAYNYLDADSSDDDRSRRHRRHSPHKESRSPRSIKKELIDECDRKSRQMPSRVSLYQSDPQEDDGHQLRRSRRQIRHQSVEDKHFVEHTRTRSERRKIPLQTDDDTDNDEGKDGEESDGEDEKEQDSDDEEAKDQDSDNEEDISEYSDMYSRAKRRRVRRSLNIYGDDDDQQNRNNNRRDDSDEEEEPSSIRRSKRIYKKREVPQIVKSYSLREHKPRTDLYKAPVEERRIKKPTTSIFEVTPTKKTSRQPYQSPAQRKKSRKRSAAMHSSSSSTSSSSGESSDEKSFRKRKAKSMAKARSRMMPMNFSNTEPPSGVIKDRVKSGASLADVEPMNIDKNISFDSIGGLGKHIRALKEMVVFPLLYDKVFQKFNVDPPRGVLFYGPPGTGKTLVARALANECSHGDKKVAFFMRKGADCLSKWVGESERQLRLLFDQAYKYRPSIIFFDEIDGLAPVRSSRQDQIHSSIVSTLLALMDGLDSRGEIVVIGATNRIDSLDPALRRPGRFDREFLFPLPTLEARKQILKIHTSSWNPKLNERFVTELAEKCVGYCGADLKSLCTEAAMLALRRRYPQIYISNEALQLDESSIQVCAKDFFNAVNNIIPTSRRSVNSPGRPLSLHILPLLERQLNKAANQLIETFPPCLMKMTSLDAAATNKQAHGQTDAEMLLDDLASDEDEDAPSIFVAPSNKNSRVQAKKSLEGPSTSKQIDAYLNFTSFSSHQPTTFRPRIMLTGFSGQGQTSYIAPALIHKMEDLPVHVLDLPALYAVTAKTPEESCANVFHEARRKCPSIIYMPYINQWWDVLGDTLRTTLLTLIQDLNPTTPLLLLATSEQPYSCLDIQLKSLFSEMSGEVMKMANPNADERKAFFKELLLHHSCKAPPQRKTAEQMIKLMERTEKTNFLPCNISKCHEPRRMMHFTKNWEKLFCHTSSEFLSKRGKHPHSILNKTHKMSLRPTRTLHGCNNNQGRKYSDFNECNCSTTNSPEYNSNFCSNFAGINFERLRNRFERIRPCLKQVTRSKSCINTNCSNNHLSDRHVRYLKRINKNFCSLKLSERHLRYLKRIDKSRYLPSSSGFVIKHHLKKTTQSRAGLSSGSIQMLYRKSYVDSHVHSDVGQILPINLTHLEREKFTSGKSAFCHYFSRSNTKEVLARRRSRKKRQKTVKAGFKTKRMLEVLPKAAPVKPMELTKQEMNSLLEKEELTLMELRIFLRDVLHKLGSDKKFSIFTKPVNIENAPDYYDVIENPMDMSTMMSKIDCHEYSTVRSFMDDIDLICSNALEYNPDRGPMDKVIRHRACALKDTAYAIIRTELDKEFEKMCVEIEESRKRRGVKSTTVPNFYRTKPIVQNGEPSTRNAAIIPSYLDSTRPVRSIPKPDGERFSRRVRGLQIDPTPSLEEVERKKASPQVNKKDDNDVEDSSNQIPDIIEGEESVLSQEIISDHESGQEETGANDSVEDSEILPKPHHSGAQTDPVSKKSRNKCVWCRPSRKRRRKFLQDHMNLMRIRKMALSASKSRHEEKRTERSRPSSVNQPLNIDTSESTETDMKSPVRKSVRIGSPTSIPSGVTTRRQSLSPRASKSSVETKLKDLPQEGSLLQETAKTEEQKEITQEVVDKSNTGEKLNSAQKNDQTDQVDVSELLGKKLENLTEAVESQSEAKKASVVKSLDLDFSVVDSGAGSSLEGNGDSRDSMDNKLEDAQPTSSSSSHLKDFNENNKEDKSQNDSSIFNECSNKLVVPTQKLSNLLDQLVVASEGFNVECLEKIYSQLSQIVFKHRHSYNRLDMLTELEKKVVEMTRRLSTVSSNR